MRLPLVAGEVDQLRPSGLAEHHVEPHRDDPQVVRREAVGARERHDGVAVVAGQVGDRAARLSDERAALDAEARDLLRAGGAVGVVEDPLEADAEPRERLVLPLDRPVAHAPPQGERVGLALLDAAQQPLCVVVDLVQVARDRRVPVGHLGDGRLLAHVARVQVPHEVVALDARLLRRARRRPALVARHRLAHRAARVADVTLALDVRAGGPQRAGDRLPERDVAQVPDVQRLRRVRVAEVDDRAGAGLQAVRLHAGQAAGLQPRAGGGDPLVGEAHQEALTLLLDGRDRRGGAQRVEPPLGERGVARDRADVVGVLLSEHRHDAERVGVDRPQRRLDVVQQVVHHPPSPMEARETGLEPATIGLEGRCSTN